MTQAKIVITSVAADFDVPRCNDGTAAEVLILKEMERLKKNVNPNKASKIINVASGEVTLSTLIVGARCNRIEVREAGTTLSILEDNSVNVIGTDAGDFIPAVTTVLVVGDVFYATTPGAGFNRITVSNGSVMAYFSSLEATT